MSTDNALSSSLHCAEAHATHYEKRNLPGVLRAHCPPRFGIAELAHRLYEERGRQEGHHLEDWIEAERRISGKQVRTKRANSQRKFAAAGRARTWARRRIRLLDRNGNGAAR